MFPSSRYPSSIQLLSIRAHSLRAHTLPLLITRHIFHHRKIHRLVGRVLKPYCRLPQSAPISRAGPNMYILNHAEPSRQPRGSPRRSCHRALGTLRNISIRRPSTGVCEPLSYGEDASDARGLGDRHRDCVHPARSASVNNGLLSPS